MSLSFLGSDTIILEGVDGMGKSHLAQQLGDYLQRTVITCGPAPTSAQEVQYWADTHENYVIRGDYILDRVTAFSHYVYKTVLCGGTPYADYLLSKAKNIAYLGAVVVYCKTANPAHKLKDYDTPEQIKLIEQNIEPLHDGYMTLFETIGVKPFHYDWTDPLAFSRLLTLIGEHS